MEHVPLLFAALGDMLAGMRTIEVYRRPSSGFILWPPIKGNRGADSIVFANIYALVVGVGKYLPIR